MREKSRFAFCATALAAFLAFGVAAPSANATNNVISGSTERTCASSSSREVSGPFDTGIFALASGRPEDLDPFDSRFCDWDAFGLLKFTSFPMTGFTLFIR